MLTREEWTKAEPVLTAALALPEEERQKLIDTAFLEAALRQELLAVLERASGVVPAAAGGPRHAPVPRHVSLSAGDAIEGGRFVVIRQIGRGGMGSVYLAHDTMLGTLVALKAVPFDERLLSEARRAAVCSSHPNVATIHNILRTEAGGEAVGLLVMEYIAGTPASRLIDDGPVDVERVVRWGRQIAAAVAHAHDHQVLHCDLKPANIVITAEDRATVLDFGIARATFEDGGHEPLRGTLSYMAPEQLVAGEFTPAGDIYAIGVTLFELLAGRRPFEGDPASLRMQILAAPPPPLQELVPGLPVPLVTVVEKAMAKDPDQRFRSARSLERALKEIETGVRHSTGTVTVNVPVGAASDSRFVQLGAIAAAGGAVVVAIGFVSSRALDVGLGRTGSFRVETALDWPLWGLMSFTMPALVWLAVVAATVLAVGVCRGLGHVSALQRWCQPVSSQVAAVRFQIARRLAASQYGLVAVQVATLVLLVWAFMPVMQAISAFMGHDSSESLAALSPSHVDSYSWLRLLLFSHLMIFGLLWAWLVRRGTRVLLPAAVAGSAAALVTLFLFAVPFRVLHHNEHRRVQYGDDICYQTGQTQDDVLLFCPRLSPRTRIIDAADPRLRRSNVTENIFTAFDGAPAR